MVVVVLMCLTCIPLPRGGPCPAYTAKPHRAGTARTWSRMNLETLSYERVGGDTRPGSFGSLLARGAGGELGDDVEVADVPGVLLEQVEQDPFQGSRVRAIPSFTVLAHVG